MTAGGGFPKRLTPTMRGMRSATRAISQIDDTRRDERAAVNGPRGRLVEADLLRVAAMISVIAVHSVAWMGLTRPEAGVVYPALDRFMRFGVPVFVFLTGYVLVYGLRNKRLDPWRFSVGRVRRVVTPFLTWVLIYLAAYVAIGMVSVHSPRDVLELIWNGTIAGHLYFLGVACQFYLLYMVFPRSRRAAVALLAVAVPVQLGLAAARGGGWTPPAPFDIAFGYQAQWFGIWWIGYYALGAVAAWYRQPLLEWLGAHRRLVLAALAVVAPLAVFDMWRAGAVGYDNIFRPSTFFMTAAVIAALMSLVPLASRLRTVVAGHIELLAQRSLGVYLVHPLVLMAAGTLVQNSWVPLDFDGPLWLTAPTLLAVVVSVLVVSLAIVGLMAWLPGGWLIGGREEARVRIRNSDEPPAVSQAA
jgi:peptidoglycan/LPS O-acetylase OafA/YrhL